MPHPMSPLLKAPAILPDAYFSALRHYVEVINISFSTEQLLFATIRIKLKLWLHHTTVNKKAIVIDRIKIAITAKSGKNKAPGRSGQVQREQT